MSADLQSHPMLCGCASCRGSAGAEGAAPVQAAAGSAPFAAAPSGTHHIDALLSPSEYRWNYNAPGTPLTLSYGFMTMMPWYAASFGNESGPFQAFTAAQQDGVHRAVALFEQVANIDFVYRADGNNAQVRFGSAVLGAWEAAHAYYPDPVGDWGGDIWFNTTDPSVPNQNAGSYGFLVTIHELGHALGLKHSFSDGTFSGAVLSADKDSRQYTVMSYNRAPTMLGVEASSLMLYDIAALQYLYGANTGYRTGNDVWQWAPGETFRACIWDAGGNDTIDASNQTRRAIINLNPGTFSSIGAYRFGDAVDNLSIAFNCWVENATGGSGNDVLYASQVANALNGNGGTDSVSYKFATGAITFDFSTNAFTGYAAGDAFTAIEIVEGTDWNDTFIGGAHAAGLQLRGGFGFDTFVATSGVDLFDGGDGNDTVSYANSSSAITARLDLGTITGGFATSDVLASIENVIGSNFYDTLVGNSGANVLIGGAGDDYLDGRGGADQLIGGLGNDTYELRSAEIASLYPVVETANGGIDTIRTDASTYFMPGYIENLVYTGTSDFTGYGDSADNRIEGGTGNDRLVSFSGTDTLIGGSGNDVLEGGTGADVLDGGSGIDWASYESSNGVTVDLFGTLTGEAAGDSFIGIEGFIGSTYDDVLRGDAGDNLFRGMGGQDMIDGRGGHDSAFYRGTARDYEITTDADGVQTIRALRSSLLQRDGVDTLVDIESIQFEGTLANAAPVIASANAAIAHGGSVHVGSLYSASDADLDIIHRYQIRDLTDGAGFLTIDGVAQATNQVVDALYSGSPNVRYNAGQGSDLVQIRAFDGVDWSAWATLSLTPANFAPSVTASGTAPTRGTIATAASSLIAVSDADGDTMLRYRFFDGTIGNGRFTLSGAPQVEYSNIEITAAQLTDLRFVSGAPGSTDILWAQVFDGFVWSAWTSFAVTSPQNSAPVALINASSLNPGKGTTTIAASSFFSATDADNDAITQYRFFDGTMGSGRFERNGTPEAELANITVAATDIANFRFRLGAGSDVLWVQAYDGMSWGAWKTFTVAAPANAAPVVTVQTLNPAKSTAFVAGSALFTVTDADDASMAKYRFFDGTAGNGRFQLNGADQAELANIEIDAADLADFRYRTSTTGTGDTLWVQAFDGTVWGAWKSFTATAPVNVAPTVYVHTLNPAKSAAFIAGADLFTVTDPDDPGATKFRFFDGTVGNGRFQLNGVDQAELANIEIDAAGLADFRYRTSTTGAGDTLWVQAFDGFAWGTWKSFTANAPVNVAPTVHVHTLNPARTDAFIAGADLFTVTDPDDAGATKVRFFDGTAGNGRFQLNGVDQAELVNIEIAAADLADFRYRTSTTGAGDMLWVQAFDGFAWGEWKSFTANAPANNLPVAIVANRTLAANTAVAASTLFSVADGDGDPITRYQFWDSTVGGGSFRIGGAAQGVNVAIDVMAGQLASADFLSGGAAGVDQLWARAYDGSAWGEWKLFTVTTLAPS